ncbi:unnamed protein product, partial [Polarella glacialis]
FRSLPSFLGGDSRAADEREGYDELELASEPDPAPKSVTKRMVSFSRSGPEAVPSSPRSSPTSAVQPLVRQAVSYSFNTARTVITQDEGCPRELSHTSWWKKFWKQMVIKPELEESSKAKGYVHWVESWLQITPYICISMVLRVGYVWIYHCIQCSFIAYYCVIHEYL